MKMTVNRPLMTAIALSGFLMPMAVLSGGFSGVQSIDSVRIHGDGTVSVRGADGGWRNPDSCDDSSKILLDPQHNFYREILATILSAHVSDREIKFRLKGCGEMSGTLYPVIQQVEMF